MPAFTQGDDRQHEAVFAIVGGIVHALADHVAQAVDGEGAMPQQDRADAEGNQALQATGWTAYLSTQEPTANSQCDGWQVVELIDEAQLWEAPGRPLWSCRCLRCSG